MKTLCLEHIFRPWLFVTMTTCESWAGGRNGDIGRSYPPGHHTSTYLPPSPSRAHFRYQCVVRHIQPLINNIARQKHAVVIFHWDSRQMIESKWPKSGTADPTQVTRYQCRGCRCLNRILRPCNWKRRCGRRIG